MVLVDPTTASTWLPKLFWLVTSLYFLVKIIKIELTYRAEIEKDRRIFEMARKNTTCFEILEASGLLKKTLDKY